MTKTEKEKYYFVPDIKIKYFILSLKKIKTEYLLQTVKLTKNPLKIQQFFFRRCVVASSSYFSHTFF